MNRPVALLSWAIVAAAAVGHEGHAPLPSRGATVDLAKGTIVLSRESREALGVEAAEISTKPLSESASAYVTLVSPWTKHAFVSSRLPGRIATLAAAPGKNVEAGEPLAEVESLELENLHAELLQAQTERRLAERMAASLRESADAVAGQALFEAETTLEQQRSAELVGRLKWRSLGLTDDALDAFLRDPSKRVRRLVLKAPISGRVIHADVALGRVVEPGEHLFEIADLSTVWARVGVLERDLARANVGAKVQIRTTSSPTDVVSSGIDVVGPALNGPGRTATAWATLTNDSARRPQWLPGMTGLAKIVTAPSGAAQVVPSSALIDNGVSQFVLVEEAAAQKQSEYRRKDVVVVKRTAKAVEVHSSSLFPGDRVVTKGAQQLGAFFIPTVLKLNREAATTLALEFASVERRSLAATVELDGVVELPPESKSAASARLGGNILRIHVDRGQTVKRGDVLAEIQSVELQSLQLELLKEALTFEFSERRLQAMRSLGDVVPLARRLEVEAAAVSARNRRDTLRRRLEMIGLPGPRLDELLATKRLVDSAPVYAPIDGVVAGFDKALGQIVRTEEPLFTIYDVAKPLLKVFVPERDVGALSIGQSARVRFVADPNEVVSGKVVRSSGVFSPEDQSLAVWVELDSHPSSPLRVGQFARVSVAVSALSDAAALVVPPSGVVKEGNRRFAFVQRPDGVLDRRAVVAGRSNDQFVEILSGLNEGEKVAVRGVAGLRTAHASIR